MATKGCADILFSGASKIHMRKEGQMPRGAFDSCVAFDNRRYTPDSHDASHKI